MKNESGITSFTKLKVWQEGHQLVINIYQTTKKFPKEETYSLIDQMRRAATSVTSNVAEGFGRHTYKEKSHFYYCAQGSLVELQNQILIAKDVGYLNQEDYQLLVDKAISTHRLLRGLIRKTNEIANDLNS
jgi:four helix bundle protein